MNHFQEHHLKMACQAFTQAEILTGRRLRLTWNERRRHHYDVRTLAGQREEEKKAGAFAHLCRYQMANPGHEKAGKYFYRICLQDDLILAAAGRSRSHLSLSALLLYIATHELIHVTRFYRGDANFDALEEERQREEDLVHEITKEILRAISRRDTRLICDCFSPRYLLPLTPS
jgi:hypothetical protein